ncbi:MAG TPA: sarcosine oxidase subunit alpha family protein [Steroidobacteraceae bacterium]|jgi:heterotetrameric sarcosine oxidase alpha subunit|nr:sarcosine oxidase subunit alpha family protein [Steroidobacteraceae bacterium]
MNAREQQEVAQPNRLAGAGRIDRSRPLSFRFDGRRYTGFAGDTLASALLAANVRLVGRSFKYHRPRGILTAGSEEPNALVELRDGARREANTRATVAELYDGLDARSQNRWPSLALDVGAASSLFAPLLVAGFYYKTFMWPAALWEKLYEPAIRRAAGLGRASQEADPDSYEKAHAFCDVLIVGAGPAGLAAASAAASAGARVILCDEDFLLGGRLNSERFEIDGMRGASWAQQVEAELRSHPEVRILRRTTVFGTYDGGLSGARSFGALERVADHVPIPPAHQPRQRLWKIVAKRTVLTAGAVERPIVFGGNDRPGVMMASAVRTYLNRFGVVPGRRAALFTTSDDGWKAAFDLAAVGVRVVAIIDARREVAPALLAAAEHIETQVLCGAQVVDAHGARGLDRITVRDHAGERVQFRVDVLAVSGGWNPSVALSTHVGGRPRWADTIAAFVPDGMPRGMVVAGAAGGSFTLADALREGAAAGAEAAQATGFTTVPRPDLPVSDELTAVVPLWSVEASESKAFVDFQHDVTCEDVALAAREGFRSVEHLKRYTTLGMATDQGRASSINGHAIMAALTERAIPELGTTTSRPPYTPVALAAFAGIHRGKHFKPTRLTSGHAWAEARGATFMESGDWLRAQWFAAPGETDWLSIVSREVKTVRSGVGVCDVSTLGKIDIQGQGAASFLDRVYSNLFSTLPIGRVRYGLMLREDGLVMDDGTSARLAPRHYIMSTTTANAAKVMRHLEHARQVLWPELDVQIVSVTEQWAQYAIAGPNARHLLERLLGDAIDVSNSAFPYLACAEFAWRGVTARLFRISFSGELAYELAVPARFGDSAIRAILSAGEPFGVVPYGIEALSVMRIEKGHVTGNELNGTTTAADVGLGRMMSTKKDFIGRVLAQRPGLADPDRPQLIGIRPVDPSARLYGGAHFLKLGEEATLANDQGYVTSVAFSPMLGHWIGLGLLVRGRERRGERLRAHSPVRGGEVEVEVVAPVFFDPDGARLHG